ncbi:hypothetical protein COY33_00190 [candidate division WWE3 bacterium CG_4_10_14_0_2_um_filter_42_7]|uniref:Uncharacterized protein n=2 Tax=Katanobacteria TaxID=422282 RepID=A0A2H0XC31_UNCKA|nr:MAG: hypothetical protein COT51_01475 [candidate division WWE3 bacterium CG08_land_8_20_14_0_20_41_15]PIZ44137.1 MAG: hypothetical protein COY33_00190 [candidate division WWE3 bacterium CG_4_10_14_0_2_um_filter_42_7]
MLKKKSGAVREYAGTAGVVGFIVFVSANAPGSVLSKVLLGIASFVAYVIGGLFYALIKTGNESIH